MRLFVGSFPSHCPYPTSCPPWSRWSPQVFQTRVRPRFPVAGSAGTRVLAEVRGDHQLPVAIVDEAERNVAGLREDAVVEHCVDEVLCIAHRHPARTAERVRVREEPVRVVRDNDGCSNVRFVCEMQAFHGRPFPNDTFRREDSRRVIRDATNVRSERPRFGSNRWYRGTGCSIATRGTSPRGALRSGRPSHRCTLPLRTGWKERREPGEQTRLRMPAW